MFEDYTEGLINLNELKDKLCANIDRKILEISLIFMLLKEDKEKNENTLEKYIDQFFEIFGIVVKFPDEMCLGKILKEKMSQEFSTFKSDLVYGSFEAEMIDFFKVYEKGWASFYTNTKAKKKNYI